VRVNLFGRFLLNRKSGSAQSTEYLSPVARLRSIEQQPELRRHAM
jgi:hypothetical protein